VKERGENSGEALNLREKKKLMFGQEFDSLKGEVVHKKEGEVKDSADKKG